MKDIVEMLRGVGCDYDFHENSLVHAAVEEIESLRAKLAEAQKEIQEQSRLNGMGSEREVKLLAQLEKAKAEIACEERRFSDLWEQLCSTQAQLAEVSAQRNASNRKIEELTDQLLATQAHTARVVEALKIAEYGDAHFDHRGDGQNYCPECGEKKGCAHSQNCIIGKALSTPINLAALHEDRARECERLANLFPRGSIPAHNMLEEAAAHRAKKEGK